MLLNNLVVAMVIRRPKQLAGDAAPVDDLEIPLRRFHFGLGGVEEFIEMFAQYMRHGGLVALKRNAIRH